ncbi:MAG TPA: dihydrofolate reductase family protein [Devosia sp.]
MKLVSQQFLSLDGVYQGPGSPDEDRTGGFDRGGWLVPFIDDAFERRVEGWMDNADAFLFGRRTYEDFAKVWPTITNPADRNAARLNQKPKYVAANSAVDPAWQPATMLSGDIAARVAEIKQLPGREMQIHGSGALAASMLRAGLIDELRLAVAPVVVGAGRKLLQETDESLALELIDETRTPKGLLIQRLRYVGPSTAGTYHRPRTEP